ncbi:MAG: arylsulfatase [Candidatus Hydrogenedentes bacterium]|nr:arylsulfatase [Candidatus Hydrogenedentota bacterium]
MASTRGYASPAEAKPPNIVLILADDLGYGHLGCYGQKHIRTPHIDQLAQDGMRFTQAYAGCSQCAPSRSVLMTGYHSGHTPVRGNSGGISLRDEDVTVAEVLKRAGYRTGLFGKWGLGDADTPGVPNKQGFDEFFGYLHQKHAHFYYTDYLWHNDARFALPGNVDGKREQYTPDVILDRALDFIRESREGPFFCFVSSTIPHHEWAVPKSSLKEYAGKFDEQRPEFRWREGYAFPKEPKATMAAMISHLDKSVGKLVGLLDELKLRDDTLVLFTSDNGPDSYSMTNGEFFEASGPLRGRKYELYEGGIRVPAIARWTGTITAGVDNDLPIHFADIMPTFAELAGDRSLPPSDIDGISVAPALLGARRGGVQEKREFMYWDLDSGSRAVRMDEWKLVLPKRDAKLELYDLKSDIGESRDVSADHPDVVEKMRACMDANYTPPPPQIEPPIPDGRQYR